MPINSAIGRNTGFIIHVFLLFINVKPHYHSHLLTIKASPKAIFYDFWLFFSILHPDQLLSPPYLFPAFPEFSPYWFPIAHEWTVSLLLQFSFFASDCLAGVAFPALFALSTFISLVVLAAPAIPSCFSAICCSHHSCTPFSSRLQKRCRYGSTWFCIPCLILFSNTEIQIC